MKLIVPIIYNKSGQPVPKATVRINIGTNTWITDMTNDRGMASMFVDEGLQNTQFEVYACNYKDYGQSINLGADGNKQIRVGLSPDADRPQDIILPPLESVRPNWSREELLLFRGALNIKAQPKPRISINGISSVDGIWHQTEDDRELIIRGYHERNYTHGPVGPFIDGGYHNLTPATDFRNDAERENIEKNIAYLQQSGIITPLFLTPDGWTVEQLRSIEDIYKQDVWQSLGAEVVNGFEQQGSKYGWSNQQYCEYLAWMKEVFPNAVRGLHTISGIEQPVGQGDDTSKPGMSPNDCWGRVAQYIDFWLTQFDMWDNAWIHVDPTNPDGKTDLEHWYQLWDRTNPGSFPYRFSSVGSWNQASNVIPIAGEFWSFGLCWDNLSEDMGRGIGRHAIELGAHGSFDGC